MKEVLNDNLIAALTDYKYLLEKGYPQKEIQKLTGNRYDLDRTQRSILKRGIATDLQVKNRKNKTISGIQDQSLIVDGYNVLYTVSNYLHGRIVFKANDNFIRDTGEVTGKNHTPPLFNKAIDSFLEVISGSNISGITMVFDSPVSKSGELASMISVLLQKHKIHGDSIAIKSTDKYLKEFTNGIVCTSDSVILDNCKSQIFDLAGYILNEKFKARFLSICDFLES